MRVLEDDGHTLDDGHRHKRPEDPTKPAHWRPEEGKTEMIKGKYTPASADEYVLEWSSGGCNNYNHIIWLGAHRPRTCERSNCHGR